MRRASAVAYSPRPRAKSRSSVSSSPWHGLAMALNSMPPNRLARVRSKVELVSKLHDHGVHVGREVEVREIADRGARRLGRGLLVILEAQRELAVVGAQAVFRADRVGVEIRESVVGARELGQRVARE